MGISGLHILDIGSAVYNLEIVHTIVDLLLILLIIVSFFVFWQIKKYSYLIKNKKRIEGMNNLIDALYIIGFIFLMAVIDFIYMRIVFKYYMQLELKITLLILGILAICLLVKAMTAFSPEIKSKKRSV